MMHFIRKGGRVIPIGDRRGGEERRGEIPVDRKLKAATAGALGGAALGIGAVAAAGGVKNLAKAVGRFTKAYGSYAAAGALGAAGGAAAGSVYGRLSIKKGGK